jgi:hypothetical protein
MRHDPDVSGARQRSGASFDFLHGVFEKNQRRGARTRRGGLRGILGPRAAVVFMSSVV